MAAGQLSRRVEVRGSDEIGQLSQDFNQMAQQLEQHVGELTDTARRQEEFLHAFAHETKTPLTSIIGYAELMLSRPAQPQLVQESAACIFREGRRLEGLSRKLMDLFVLEKSNLSLRRTEMLPFLERVADVLRPALEEAGIAWRYRPHRVPRKSNRTSWNPSASICWTMPAKPWIQAAGFFWRGPQRRADTASSSPTTAGESRRRT